MAPLAFCALGGLYDGRRAFSSGGENGGEGFFADDAFLTDSKTEWRFSKRLKTLTNGIAVYMK